MMLWMKLRPVDCRHRLPSFCKNFLHDNDSVLLEKHLTMLTFYLFIVQEFRGAVNPQAVKLNLFCRIQLKLINTWAAL